MTKGEIGPRAAERHNAVSGGPGIVGRRYLGPDVLARAQAVPGAAEVIATGLLSAMSLVNVLRMRMATA
jgi:hypothetical protein